MGEKFKIDPAIMKIDLYDLLEIKLDADDAEIKSAYRKKALKCHPDKNPNNPLAAEEFHKLSAALELLLNKVTKALYDKTLKAKKEAEIRHRQLDSKRRKFKDDLEARERAAQSGDIDPSFEAEMKLKAEIERLRKEGARHLMKEQEAIRKLIQEEQQLKSTEPTNRLRMRWHKNKAPAYTEDVLKDIFSKEVASKLEKGFSSNPLNITWFGDQERKQEINSQRSNFKMADDYESLVLRQLRQAEERRKIIAQMVQEDQT